MYACMLVYCHLHIWLFHPSVEESKVEMHGVETANLVFDYFSVEDIRMVSKYSWNCRTWIFYNVLIVVNVKTLSIVYEAHVELS